MADEQPKPFDPTSFAWWLHGWSEINGGACPTPAQWQTINDRLDSVFNKVTPDRKVTPAGPHAITGATSSAMSNPLVTYCATRTDLPVPTPKLSIESGNNQTYLLTGISGMLATSNIYFPIC